MERKIKWHPNRKLLEIIREKFQKGKTFWEEGCLQKRFARILLGLEPYRDREHIERIGICQATHFAGKG